MADAPLVPENVFTPKTIVTRAMFERRNEPDADGNPGVQDRLQDALRERGAQLLIFGDESTRSLVEVVHLSGAKGIQTP